MSNNPLYFRSVYCFQYCPSCPTCHPSSPQAFGHALYMQHPLCLNHFNKVCDLPCGLFADRWDAFCNCPSRQLVDSMCKSVEVVHKLHTVVHILPEVDCLECYHNMKVFPWATIHSTLEVCIASNTVLPAQPVTLPLPKHLGMHCTCSIHFVWTISIKYVTYHVGYLQIDEMHSAIVQADN